MQQVLESQLTGANKGLFKKANPLRERRCQLGNLGALRPITGCLKDSSNRMNPRSDGGFCVTAFFRHSVMQVTWTPSEP